MTARRLSIGLIQHEVAKAFGIDPVMMTSVQRAKRFYRPRQVGMWLAGQMLPHLSLPQIGRAFGNREHTTVMHALRKIEAMRRSDPGFAVLVDDVRAIIAGRAVDLPGASSLEAEQMAVSIAEALTTAALRLARSDPEAAFRVFAPLARELLTTAPPEEVSPCPVA